MADLLCPTLGCNNSNITIYVDETWIETQCGECGETHIFRRSESTIRLKPPVGTCPECTGDVYSYRRAGHLGGVAMIRCQNCDHIIITDPEEIESYLDGDHPSYRRYRGN